MDGRQNMGDGEGEWRGVENGLAVAITFSTNISENYKGISGFFFYIFYKIGFY